MKKEKRKSISQKGVSLVELLVVTVIISAVAAIALMQFGNSREQLRRQNVAQQLKQAFERARFDSVKRRAVSASEMAKVEITGTKYTLFTDQNGDGFINSSDAIVNDLAGQAITITGNSMGSTATVTFDKRGEISVTGITNPEFLICNGTCSFGTDNVSNSNIVMVTATGTVNLLAGGSTIQPFETPQNSTVSTATGIKDDVVLP